MTKQEVMDFLGVAKLPQEAEINLDRINKMYRDDTIKKVLERARGYDMKPVDLLRVSTFELLLKQIKDTEKIQELEAKVPAENETAKSMDILGTALVEALKQTKGDILIEFAKEYIEKTYGITEKKVVLVNPISEVKLDEVHHEKLEEVAAYMQCGEPVILVGPAGTGKNVLCKQVAKLLGYEYYGSNAVQQTYQLDGFIDANGKYQDTEFYKACKSASEGHDVLFVFDEIDASNSEVLVRFNDALSSYKLEFPTETLEFADKMHFIACANTFGTGASFQYVGRNQLDAATLDRFATVWIDYSPAIEESICPDRELLEFCRSFRKAVDENNIQHIVSYRGIRRLAKMMSIPGINKKDVLKECLIKNLEANDLSMIVRQLKAGEYKNYVEEMANA